MVLTSLQDPAVYTCPPEGPPTAEPLQTRYDFWEKGYPPGALSIGTES